MIRDARLHLMARDPPAPPPRRYVKYSLIGPEDTRRILGLGEEVEHCIQGLGALIPERYLTTTIDANNTEITQASGLSMSGALRDLPRRYR